MKMFNYYDYLIYEQKIMYIRNKRTLHYLYYHYYILTFEDVIFETDRYH